MQSRERAAEGAEYITKISSELRGGASRKKTFETANSRRSMSLFFARGLRSLASREENTARGINIFPRNCRRAKLLLRVNETHSTKKRSRVA